MTENGESSSDTDERDQRAEGTRRSESSTRDETPNITELRHTLSGLDSSGKELYPGLEKMLWEWHAQTYKKPEKKRQEKATIPSRVWWIENPVTLPLTDPSHLCVVCQHIDFRYLLNSPPQQLLENVPLSSLEQIVQKKDCAFCRLIVHTIQVAFGEEELPFEIDAKPVICELKMLPIETNLAGPRQLCVYLNVLPKAKSIDASTDLLIYGISNEQTQEGERMKEKFISLSRMSLGMIRHWYLNCIDGKCGGNPSGSPRTILPKAFRLIDVQRMCIVEGNDDSRYLALSYVWGRSKTLLNTKGVRVDLETEAGLSRKLQELPKTIKDAIDLVRELGERHLWVDSLCIIQDDPEDKANQIMAMDTIYSSAVLTIAATSGSNADAGLAGGKTNLRTFTQLVEKVQGLSLANRPTTFDKKVDQSSWNNRAWTFQERSLSSRVLFVADQRCFFTCRHRPDAFMESLDDMENGLTGRPLPTLISDYSRNLIPISRAVNVLSYSRTLEAYTSRQLTYAIDILNAFEGVAARFRPLFRSDLLFGIPRSELDSQILWQPHGPMTRRRDPQTDLPIFPSWSWAGWVGKVRCNTRENLSRIEWIGDDGKTFSSKDCRYPKGANRDPVKRILYRCEWKAALENGVPYYWEVKNPDQYFLHPTALEDERAIGPNLRQGTDQIVFEAETTSAFQIGWGHYLTMAIYFHKCTTENHTVCPLPLRDPEGFIAGYVLIPGDISTNMNAETRYEIIMISRAMNISQTDRGEENPDLLVDSEATTLEKTHFPDAPDVNTSQNAYGFDERRFDSRKSWCLYNIMLVEWREGVAYRLGVGTMHIDAWAQAKPEKKTIILG
ncbi:MAG: hypothetical protein Q9161_008200 [Pseudevernia consocians]